jgi:hypothetical protein
MTTAKADCELLLNAVLPFANDMLSQHGAFHPYGGAMRPDGEIVSVAAHDGEENPPSKAVIERLKEVFVEAVRANEYKATAVVYDACVTLPSSEEKSDAVAVSLDHRDDYSVVIYFPYRIDSGNVRIGPPFAQKGMAAIFEGRPTERKS